MPLRYPIERRTLPTGLDVVVSEDHTVPAVAMNIWVGVGSAHETPGLSGFAHLFEHLMFEGSANVAKGEHFRMIQGVGGRPNANTWLERTCYHEQVPSGALELALWLEADRHLRLLPAVTQENLDNQRDVVLQERSERYDETPYGDLFLRLFEEVFPADHPFHHPTIGSVADIEAAALTDVHAFYEQHYHPGNTTIALVGDVDAQRAFDLVAKYFEPEVARPFERAPRIADLPAQEAPRRLVVRDDVPQDRLYFAYRLPEEVTEDRRLLAANAALDALVMLPSARLHRSLVRTDLATGVDAQVMAPSSGPSIGVVMVEMADGVDPRRAEDIVLAEFERFAECGPSEDELRMSTIDTERHYLRQAAHQAARARLLSRDTHGFDDPQRINTYLDDVFALTVEDLRDVVATSLRPESRTVIEYLREDAPGRPEEDR